MVFPAPLAPACHRSSSETSETKPCGSPAARLSWHTQVGGELSGFGDRTQMPIIEAIKYKLDMGKELFGELFF